MTVSALLWGDSEGNHTLWHSQYLLNTTHLTANRNLWQLLLAALLVTLFPEESY